MCETDDKYISRQCRTTIIRFDYRGINSVGLPVILYGSSFVWPQENFGINSQLVHQICSELPAVYIKQKTARQTNDMANHCHTWTKETLFGFMPPRFPFTPLSSDSNGYGVYKPSFILVLRACHKHEQLHIDLFDNLCRSALAFISLTACVY